MAIYHLSAKTGTRAGGQSALAKYDYLARRGKYARKEDKLTHLASGNMPAWAEARPASYWRAADQHERANARLYKELDVALPNELTHEQRVELAEAFVRTIARVEAGPLPFTMALHEGKPKDGGPANPHLHVAISERVNDGHDRTRETWFKRAATGKGKAPEDGGAPKTDELKPKAWLEQTRELWASMCNAALAAAGHDARIDHRTLEAQGIDRAPQVHLGPAAFGYERRTGEASRRRLEAEQRQADERAAAQAVRRLIDQAQADAAAARQQAIRLRQVAADLEADEARRLRRAAAAAERHAIEDRARQAAAVAVRAPAPAWQESPFGFDLADPLPFPDTRPSAGPYLAKALPSGVVLHLRMPADRVAFVERQDRIRMANTDAMNAESVAEALQVACAKWGEVQLSGSPEFRRLAIDQAVQIGLHKQLVGLDQADQAVLREAASRHGVDLDR